MEEDLNVYYDISTSKWWYFDQNSGTWLEQEKEHEDELMGRHETEEGNDKKDSVHDARTEKNAYMQDSNESMEPKKPYSTYNTMRRRQKSLSIVSGAQSDSDFSYEKIMKHEKMLRNLKKEDPYDDLKNTIETPNGTWNSEETSNNGSSEINIENINKTEVIEASYTNDQNSEPSTGAFVVGNSSTIGVTGADTGGRETEEVVGIVEEKIEDMTINGGQAEATAETYYGTTWGGGVTYNNYYGEGYDASAYDPNAYVSNAETGETYYTMYYDNSANNECETGYAGEYEEGYGQAYNTEYANNYYNGGEEYNAPEGVLVEGGAEYAEGYGEGYNTQGGNEYTYYNYAQEYNADDPETSGKNETYDYVNTNGINNYTPNNNDGSTTQADNTGGLQMENKEQTDENKKEQANTNETEKREVQNENEAFTSNASEGTDFLNEKINNLVEDEQKNTLKKENNALLLDQLLKHSSSFDKKKKYSQGINSEKNSDDADQGQKIESKEHIMPNENLEKQNLEKKTRSKSKVQFSMILENEQENKSGAEESFKEEKKDQEQTKDEENNDVDNAPVPFVRRATRRLTFKDQGGLSGCIKVYLEKKNELMAASTPAEVTTLARGDIDIKMANLKRRARELARRYKSKGNNLTNGETYRQKEEEKEDGMTKFHNLVLQMQKQNKQMKEAKQVM